VSLTKEVRTLRYLKGSEFILRLESPQEFEIDGDAVGKVMAIKATVDPGAIAIRVP